jgi:uncharacterized integral membrane protein (TIGR00698 family)
MAEASVTTAPALATTVRRLAPGILISALVAILAVVGAPWVARIITIPAMVLALLIGIALHAVAARPVFQPGLVFCVKTLLRWAVALLGLRIALGDIAALGLGTGIVVVVSMAVTILAGFLTARALGLPSPYGALAGVGTAVCGASATLATSVVLPDYSGKEADVVFVVVAVNALATLAMVIYPPLDAALGFDGQTTGVMLGATIHDVAQVVGAGYSVSQESGDVATIIKLLRVALLVPAVLVISLLSRRIDIPESGKRPAVVPLFLVAFVAIVLLNSVHLIPASVQTALGDASRWCIVVAIAALGIKTSLVALGHVGPRAIALMVAETIFIGLFVLVLVHVG